MSTGRVALRLTGAALLSLPVVLWGAFSLAQEQLPWQRDQRYQPPRDDAYTPNDQQRGGDGYQGNRPNDGYPPSRPTDAYTPRTGQSGAPYPSGGPPRDDAYRPPRYGQAPAYGSGNPPADDAYRPPRAGSAYEPPPPGERAYRPPRNGAAGDDGGQAYSPPQTQGYSRPTSGYGQPYTPGPTGQGYEDPPPRDYGRPGTYDRRYGPGPNDEDVADGSYSTREILGAGHQFFGSVSKGLASVIEYAFQQQGRPNGYILGQDAGGAFVAGLRYGEGTLYTKDAGTHRVYWQGPSIGYDAGVEGSKVMMLVYNLRDPEEIYRRFGGVDGSAYIVGGVGLTIQTGGDVVVAPIRSGVGLRLGANVGYLKYTRRPTWNPF
jgi:hypothetical protein